MLISRRKLIAGGAASLILPRRRALAFGGGSALDPYVMPRLSPYVAAYNAYGGRTQVAPASLSGSVGCLVIFGDSVSSNVVNSTITAAQANNYNFDVYNGGLYKTVEPLLGCNWNAETETPSGCIFTGVADTLIANSVYANVVLAPIGLGGSLLADYAAGGALNGIFAPTKARLDAARLTATGVYCMLGANDTNAGTSQASATSSLDSIISTVRGLWATTPIFVATHSIFDLATSAAVQNAQASVLSSSNAVYTGGNIDSITSSSDYWDNTHPNSTGRTAIANLISTAISAHP